MKKISLVLMLLCSSLFPSIIFAHGVKAPAAPVVTNQSSSGLTVNLVPGSLKENIERIAKNNGWNKVVWNAADDYNWVTYTTIREQNLAAIMKTILNDYPLQAIFYQGNRVLVIEARTVR